MADENIETRERYDVVLKDPSSTNFNIQWLGDAARYAFAVLKFCLANIGPGDDVLHLSLALSHRLLKL